jgi:hypothetical protein
MAQFTIYRSSDASAPSLTNATGSLITVLNDILVAGYGSKTGAGWTAPAGLQGTNHWAFLNASPASPSGSGTGFYLDVNDNGPGAGGGSEARITGYETMSTVGTGTAQFPLAGSSQGVSPYGFVVARKAVGSAARPWIAFADNLTLYFFAQTDTTTQYTGFAFGDIYSMAGSSDNWRCLIIGRGTENNIAYNYGAMDVCSFAGYAATSFAGATITHYLDRTYAGSGTSITAGKHGDVVKANSPTAASLCLGLYGCQTPNGPDNSLYVSPVWVTEPTHATVRGQMRGFWHLCHPIGTFTDGQVLTPTGALYGKTFQVVRPTESGGCIAVETSNTLLTN